MTAADIRPIVAVAGAAGFVGKALAPKLGQNFVLKGLSRATRPAGSGGYDTWVACDLFSMRDAEVALAGASVAVYLVHSMMPSARLTQGRFEDMDLICADNFARAAKAANVARIVYLGGLLPPDDVKLSRHLESRREVEETLGSHGTPVITLRAGLVIGPHGSSWQILSKLVRRLPVMACPRWTRTLTQPIGLGDAARILAACVTRDDIAAGTYDIGGPDILSYKDMMRATAHAMGKRRPMISVPLVTVGLSRLWVSTITGAPKELVAPLIESLIHPMVARNRDLQEMLAVPGVSIRDTLASTLAAEAVIPPAATVSPAPPVQPVKPSGEKRPRRPKKPPLVRSVQRLTLPPGRSAAWVADEYMRWLPTWLIARVLRVEVDDAKRCRFHGPGMKRPLLELTLSADRSRPDRVLFYITGGLLARPGGRPRLEFREVLGARFVLAAIHEFQPRLPWFVYASTQAIVHLWVMRAFGRHLERLAHTPDPTA